MYLAEMSSVLVQSSTEGTVKDVFVISIVVVIFPICFLDTCLVDYLGKLEPYSYVFY